MFAPALMRLAKSTLDVCRAGSLKIVTAESCTGGLIAGLLTEIPGSSDVLERGFVVYANAAKEELLGVPAALITAEGAVSEAVAIAMAEGALRHSPADLSIAVTGVAGPGGGTPVKPVGLVHFAAARRNRPTLAEARRFGDIGRSEIRLRSVETALALLQRLL